MIVFLDIIGAVIAGTMVIITIISSIFNVQQMNYNIQTLLALNTTANQISEFLDLSYLESVGRNLKNTEDVIKSVSGNRFVYFSRAEYSDINPVEYTAETKTDANGNVFISISTKNTPTSVSVEVFNSSPFFIEHTNIFTFFDIDGNITTNINDVRYCQVDLVFVERGWDKKDNLYIKYPITFWRFFKNIYLNQLNT